MESGSRAWGFESSDSGYDVRFIYRHPLWWYVKVLPERDVIELPINEIDDYSGWDIRKTLFLLHKSNPVLYEWLRSPIVYKKDAARFNLLLEASKKYFSPISTSYHYLHMAKNNYIDDDFLLDKINDLLARKKSGSEMKTEKAIPVINTFINQHIFLFEQETALYNPNTKPPAEYLNNLLWDLVNDNF